MVRTVVGGTPHHWLRRSSSSADGVREYVGIHDGEIVAASTALDAVAAKLEWAALAVGVSDTQENQ